MKPEISDRRDAKQNTLLKLEAAKTIEKPAYANDRPRVKIRENIAVMKN